MSIATVEPQPTIQHKTDKRILESTPVGIDSNLCGMNRDNVISARYSLAHSGNEAELNRMDSVMNLVSASTLR